MKKNRFKLQFNIGTLVFGIIFIYLIISLIIFASKRHIETYQVVEGPLSGNDTHRSIVVRDEEAVISQTDGYVTYFLSRTSKVAKSQNICFISPEKYIQETDEHSSESLDAFRKYASREARSFDPDSFDSVYDFQYSISGLFLNSSELNEMEGSVIGSSSDGLVSLYTDGYEDFDESMLSADLGQNSGYLKTRLKNGSRVKEGTPLYRLIKTEDWSLYFYVSDEQTLGLSNMDSITVKFLKDDNTENASVSFVSNNGSRFCKLTFDNGLIRYADDRFLDIEIVNSSQTGLKIPVSAIVEKEFYIIPETFLTYSDEDGETGFLILTENSDGSVLKEFKETVVYAKDFDSKLNMNVYYVEKGDFSEGEVIASPSSDDSYIVKETGALKGVYSTNKGYVVFRTVQILNENSDFAIVSEGTPYGIALYDYIAKDAGSVKEEEIIH